MDAEKKQLIEAFNIERFFEWQSNLYEELPNEVKSEVEMQNEKAFQVWQNFVQEVKNGLPHIAKIGIPELTETTKKAFSVYNSKQNQAEFWDLAAMPILDFGGFDNLKNTVENGIKSEVAELREKVERGIATPKILLGKRLSNALELIDFELLEWVAEERPILQRHEITAMQTLWEVGVCQWALQELANIDTIVTERAGEISTIVPVEYLPVINQTNEAEAYNLPEPLLWEKPETDLYLLFVELVERGFLEEGTKWRSIARWIKPMFGIDQTPEEIALRISRVKSNKSLSPPKLTQNGKKIKRLLNEVEKESDEKNKVVHNRIHSIV